VRSFSKGLMLKQLVKLTKKMLIIYGRIRKRYL
jgi:hypothetical protein